MGKRFARWMAKRQHKRQKLLSALRWYGKWGEARMSAEEKIDYAGLLHDLGQSDRALALLELVLKSGEYAHAYERRAHIYNERGREEDAVADMDHAIRLDPEPYIYWYTRAVAHHDLGRYEEAVNDFREALRRRDDSKASTYYELGNVYMKTGRFPEAEDSYRRAATDPDKAIPHYYYRLAQSLERSDNIPDALIAIEAGIRLQDEWRKTEDKGAAAIRFRTNYSPAAVASFIGSADDEYGFRPYRARLLEASGRTDEALRTIEQTLVHYPDEPELELRRGCLIRDAGRAAEAAEAFERLTAREPSFLPAYMELATTHRVSGDYKRMTDTLLAAKERYPDHTVVRYWLADAYREGEQADHARIENEELTTLEPDDPLNWKQKAEIAIDGERYGDAEEALTRAIALDDTADARMRRSFSRYMSERYEEAMMDVQEAVRRDESLLLQSKTAYAMGELLVGMGNWELADKEFTRAIELEPGNAQLFERRARCRFSSDRLEDAKADCDRGLLLDLNHAGLNWLRGLIRYRLDDYEGALADSLAYSALAPEDSQGYHNLGLIYSQLDRNDDAIDAFSKSIELNPFEAQAYLERATLAYRYSFDRAQAADDLAQWLLYAGGEQPPGDRFALLADVPGFDDDMRERAKDQFLLRYGGSRYLS
ncbi:tetratricopeptide repeat protein [Cohnella suwonensis]|uniref:Tetratricopeptide repeat protein n=1 Tax=Cohnella suwonensis TaxID=696072 RepID=A0ABW0LQH4_9BACL